MNHDMYFTEVKRIERLEIEKRLRAQELSEQKVFEASCCCILIVVLILIAGFFS